METKPKVVAIGKKNRFDVSQFDVKLYDKLVSKGLSSGVQDDATGQVCIENAICTVLGWPGNDHPKCVPFGIAEFKITLNDANWSSPKARARGLSDLGLAQLGSKGIITEKQFHETFIEILKENIFNGGFDNEVEDVLRIAFYGMDSGFNRFYFENAIIHINETKISKHLRDEVLTVIANIALTVFKEYETPGCELI